MNPKDVLKKIGEWAALLAVLGTIGSYWIDSEVERRMKELEKDPAKSVTVVENRTRLDSLEAGQARIENKVDRFSEKFLEYLERQSQ